MRKLNLIKIPLAFLLVLALIPIPASIAYAANPLDLSITVIDVGQGDSILLQSDGQTMLVDAGTSAGGTKVVDYLRNHNIPNIDYLVATHPDADHIGGVAKVLNYVDLHNNVLSTAYTSSTATYQNFLKAISNEGVALTTPAANTSFTFGDSTVLIISNGTGASNTNDSSLVLKVTCGGKSVLLTGDISQTVESRLVNDGLPLDSDVLKVGHHGSASSSSAQFLSAITPGIAIISCGLNNTYGHPTAAALGRLSAVGSDIHRTDLEGSIVVAFLDGSITLNGDSFEPPPDSVPVERFAGTNRSETAVAISKQTFPGTSKSVIIASAATFPDALAASALAGVTNAPILLTDKWTLNSSSKKEITRLQPSIIYILGSKYSISETIESQLQALPSAPTTKRLGGQSRYETAGIIANEAVAHGASNSQVIIALGDNFPDALAISPFSAGHSVPILLTSTASLNEHARRFIVSHNITDATIVGSSKSVSENVRNELYAIGVTMVDRFSGKDRYETAYDIVNKATVKWEVSPSLIGVASGENFPDALAGGASLGVRDGILILIPNTKLHSTTKTMLNTYKSNAEKVEIYGGTTTITLSAENLIKGTLS